MRVGDWVRIIAGSVSGRKLKTPSGRLTRPTLDRTRESVFNILAATSLRGASVLDVFAGTGALGLEALSRGAVSCVFIDQATQELLRKNIEVCGFDAQCEVIAGPARRALARLQGRQFQFIFADPPYNKNLVNNTIAFIYQYKLLAFGGLLLMEHSKEEPIDDNPLYEIIREKAYGKDTRISFIRYRREGA